MKQYNVTGMSCAACSAAVEKAVNAVNGVTACSVSLLTNSMGVEGSADESAVIAAVEKAGYGASVKGGTKNTQNDDAFLKDTETPKIAKRLIASLAFLLLLMYISMGYGMLGLPVPHFFGGNYIALALSQMLIAAIVMVINQKFFISGTKSLLHRSPNMDTLVALGSGVSFLWSVWVLIRSSEAYLTGTAAAGDLYFESAAGKIKIIGDGVDTGYSEEEATKILSEKEITVTADIKMGQESATAWGCDLTHGYISINADYRS